MARIVLKGGITLKGARRMMTTHGSSLRITQRHGKLYTFKRFKCVQPNSDAQLECRELLKRANEQAKSDMKEEGRKHYWTEKAREMGYKTAMGCARAWYISELKGRALSRKEDESKEAVKIGEITAKAMREGKKSKRISVKRDVVVIKRRWKASVRRRASEIVFERVDHLISERSYDIAAIGCSQSDDIHTGGTASLKTV